MGLTFQKSTITGMITASTTNNRFADTIVAEDFRYLGEVGQHLPSETINNGVIAARISVATPTSAKR